MGSMYNMVFDYPGDEEASLVAWFKARLRGIVTCIRNDLPESCLALIYSGIDTFGFIASPCVTPRATRETFIRWCETYILPCLDAELTAIDLYAARCGVLHTSTPVSDLSLDGTACELWYTFNGKTGVNLNANLTSSPIVVDICNLGIAFKRAGLRFIEDLNNDLTLRGVADKRAQRFFRWGTMDEAESGAMQ